MDSTDMDARYMSFREAWDMLFYTHIQVYLVLFLETRSLEGYKV